MAEDGPPRKRAKVQLQKSPKYWFKTGDVVLVANKREAFKVHSDFLGQRSKVFRDLLSGDLPQPTNQETMDGSPVIPLSDDHEDFRIFLDLIYNNWDFHWHFDDELPKWSIIRVMIILGDKYDVPTFRDEGIRRLKLVFSEDLEEWDQGLGFDYGVIADSISIARVTRTLEQEYPDLHAAALYSCCTLPLPTLLQGIGDSVSDTALHPEDLRRCLWGRDTLLETWYDSKSELFHVDPPPENECLSLEKCAVVRIAARSALSLHRHKFHDDSYCPLNHGFMQNSIDDAEEDGLCQHCSQFYKDRLFDMRQKIRAGLKDRFKLPESTVGVEVPIDATP